MHRMSKCWGIGGEMEPDRILGGGGRAQRGARNLTDPAPNSKV